jgi:Cu/Ag efflux protein CusF
MSMNTKNTRLVLALAVALGTCAGALAQQPAANSSSTMATAPGKALLTDVVKTTATVVGVDAGTRVITLKRQDGKVVTMTAGEEVRNFPQIKVGDRVDVEYGRALALELRKGNAAKASANESAAVVSAPQGQKPAAGAVREVTVLADVVGVDTANKIVTLKGPAGNVVEMVVKDPAQLANIKKGDQVQAVYTESLAIKVSAAAAKDGDKKAKEAAK